MQLLDLKVRIFCGIPMNLKVRLCAPCLDVVEPKEVHFQVAILKFRINFHFKPTKYTKLVESSGVIVSWKVAWKVV